MPTVPPTTKATTPRDLGLATSIPLPKRKDWRIGLVGFGGIAEAHTKAYLAAGWNIVAVADPIKAARDRAQRKLPGAAVYDEYQRLMNDDAVEVVAILTQPTLREPIVAAAAEAKKHMLIEKPFGSTVDECHRMVALAHGADVKLAVSQNYRFMTGPFYAKQIVSKGLIGKPYLASIEIFFVQDEELGKHSFYATCDGFLTLQWNNHLADLLRDFFDRDAKRLMTVTRRMNGQNFKSDGLLLSVIDFGEGMTGHILHNELVRSPMTKIRGRIDGDAGSVLFDIWGDEIELAGKRWGAERMRVDASSPKLIHSMCGTMGDLLISIEQNREPILSGARNLATIRHVLADEQSARAGGIWVEP
jgi:predicted dehydrogenase